MGFIPDSPSANSVTVNNSGGGRFVPDSSDSSNGTSDGSSTDSLKSIFNSEMGGAKSVINLANTPFKKILGDMVYPGSGTSFQDDADAKSRNDAGNASFKGMNPYEVENKLGDIADSSFKNSFMGGVEDGLTTPNMIFGVGARYAGMAKDAIGEGVNTLKNNIARMALNPEFRSTASTVKYGQDAKRVMQSMPDVVGPDVHSTLDAVNNKLQETGKAIGDTMVNHPNANVKLDASKAVLQPFTDKISELNKQDPEGNAALIARLKSAQQSLIKKTDADGNVVGTHDLQNMTAKELFYFRQQKIDPRTRYTGNPSDDKDLNSVFQEVKANVRDLTNKNMPELKPLNQDYGDLHAAGDALQKLSNKVDNEGLPSINFKDIATVGIHKWLANPINRINMSRWLYTAPKEDIQQAAQAIPGFNAGVKNSYGGVKNPTVVTTPKSTAAPISKGVTGPATMSGIGKQTLQGLPEGASPTARTGANAETPIGSLPNPNTTPIRQSGTVPAGLPEPFQGRSGVDRPWENQGLPTPSKAGQSSGPVIKQGTSYTPPEGPKKFPQTDFGHQIKYQMQQKENVPLHPAQQGKEELAKIYPAIEKGNPNVSMHDIKDFNDMKDWELSQNPGGQKVFGGTQMNPDRTVISSGSAHSEAFKKVSGNSEPAGFSLLKKASNGEDMTLGEKLKVKMMIEDFRKNIKPLLGGAAAVGLTTTLLGSNANAAENINMNKIYQIESSNNPSAYNKSTKATGLGQITPIVVKDWNNMHPKENHNLLQMRNSKLNQKVSDWYMNKRIPQLLKHYGLEDNTRNRLISYNAGINYVKNNLPLKKETMDYIRKYGG